MKKFFEENKIFLAVVIGALIIGGAIYFSPKSKTEKQSQPDISSVATSPVQCLAPAEALATKIVDGDTIIVEGGYNVRLLGIDADERGYPCYEEASKRLEELILNKKVPIIGVRHMSDTVKYEL